MTQQQGVEPRRYTRDGDVYTCHDHGVRFTMGVIAGITLPTSCSGCDGDTGAGFDVAVTTLLPPPPDGCISTVALEADANVVRADASTSRTELRALADVLRDEITELRKTKVKATEYYRELVTLAETRLRVLSELRKQGDLQIKANRRAGDYATRREDDYIVDKRNEQMGGGSH